MANAIYSKAKETVLSAGINFTTDTIKMALVSSSYTPNVATDQYWSSVSANVIGSPVQITSVTITAGVFTCSAVTFPSVASGSSVKYVCVYKDTSNAATSPLIAVFDTATGLPVSTNGSNIVVTPDSVNGIFAL